MTLDDFFKINYPRILSFAGTWLHTKNKYEMEEVVHFTIEYFYTNNKRDKLESLLESGDISKYFYKSLRTMCQSNTAPYKWKERHYITDYQSLNNYDYPTDEYDYETDFLISYKYDISMKLIYTDYFKQQYMSPEHWEYSKKIFLTFINENMSLNEISKRTNISRQTVEYNYKKVRNLLINTMKNEELMKEIIPGVDIEKLKESIDPKKTNIFAMTYFDILTEFQQNCPGVKQTLLKKAASQKAKYLNEQVPREKSMIAVDCINHLTKCKGIISDKRLAQERLNLYKESILPNPSRYNSIGCSVCIDTISKHINNFILVYRNELYDIK